MKVQAAVVAGACALGAKVHWAHADTQFNDCTAFTSAPSSQCADGVDMVSSNTFAVPGNACTRVKDKTGAKAVKNAVLMFVENGEMQVSIPVKCDQVYASVDYKDQTLFASVTAESSRTCKVDWDSVFDTPDQLTGLEVTYQIEAGAFELASTVLVQHLAKPVTVAEVYNDDYILAKSITTAKASNDNEWTHTLTVERGRHTALRECPLPSTITIQLGTSADGTFTQGTDTLCSVTASRVGDDPTYEFNTDLNHIYLCGETAAEDHDGQKYFQMDMQPSLAQSDFKFGSGQVDLANFCLGADRGVTALITSPTTCKTISHKRSLINTVTHSLFLQQVETVEGSRYDTLQYLVKVFGHGMTACGNELDYYGKLELLVEINVSPDATESSFWKQVVSLKEMAYLKNFIRARVDGDSSYSVSTMDCPTPANSRRLTDGSPPIPSKVCYKVLFDRCQRLASASGKCEFSYLGAVELGVTTCDCYKDATSERNQNDPFPDACCTVMTVKDPVIPCSSITGNGLVDTCEFDCPVRDVENKINPEFELDMTATCEDGPLSLNNEINIEVKLKDRGGASSHGFTFYIRELTVSLYDFDASEGGQPVKQVSFLRNAKKIAFFTGSTSSAYVYDAHFCRAESSTDDGSLMCHPFYAVLGNAMGNLGSGSAGVISLAEMLHPQDSSAIISRPPVSTRFEAGLLTYKNCQPITEREVDNFFFTPRYWGFNDFDGLKGKLEVSATVVLSHCNDPTSSRLLRTSTTRTLQEAAEGAVVGSSSFTIVNQANDPANCASKKKKQCKGQCVLAKGLINGQDCMSEEIFQNSFKCADLNGDQKLCGMKSGCTYNKKAKTCESQEAEEELSCGDVDKKKCNKNAKCILESWNGGKNAACVAKSSVDCSAVPKKMCKSKLLKGHCALQGKSCVSASA